MGIAVDETRALNSLHIKGGEGILLPDHIPILEC